MFDSFGIQYARAIDRTRVVCWCCSTLFVQAVISPPRCLWSRCSATLVQRKHSPDRPAYNILRATQIRSAARMVASTTTVSSAAPQPAALADGTVELARPDPAEGFSAVLDPPAEEEASAVQRTRPRAIYLVSKALACRITLLMVAMDVELLHFYCSESETERHAKSSSLLER